jgi:hypothetical protein
VIKKDFASSKVLFVCEEKIEGIADNPEKVGKNRGGIK